MSIPSFIVIASLIVVTVGGDKLVRHINPSPHEIEEARDVRSCGCEQPCNCHPKPSPRTDPKKKCACDPSCNCKIVRCSKECTNIKLQEVTENTVLMCTPDSYFTRVEYIATSEGNTTCFGLFSSDGGYFAGVYTGYKQLANGREEAVVLNAEDYYNVKAFNSGNLQRLEQTPLSGCECKGDKLSALSTYVADDPLTDCCRSGVNHLTAVDFVLNIYGHCCSQCSLHSSSRTYEYPVKN